MAVDYPGDSTTRTDSTLESSGMSFMGYDGSNNPLDTTYAYIKAAILAATSTADYILIRDVKTSGTDGGTFTNGADRTRDLTEETVDTGNHATLSSNQVTLAAGTYEFSFSAPAYSVNRHQAWLYNVSDSSVPTGGEGSTEVSISGVISRSEGKGRFTIASSKTFEIQHRCESTISTTGFGYAASFTTPNAEVYTILEFWKVA